jgi:hypothetical protein
LTAVIEPEGAVVLLVVAMSHALQFMSARQITARCSSCAWGRTGARKMRGEMPSCNRSVEVGGVISRPPSVTSNGSAETSSTERVVAIRRYSKFYFVRAMKARSSVVILKCLWYVRAKQWQGIVLD